MKFKVLPSMAAIALFVQLAIPMRLAAKSGSLS